MFEIGKLTRLPLGYVGESNSRTISIDISEWLKEYPRALIMIQVVRPVDRFKYPAAYTLENGVLHWTVDAAELVYAGKGVAQITLYDPDTKREYKSRVVGTVVAESLEGFNDILLDDADPAKKWVNQVLEAATRIEDAVVKIEDLHDNIIDVRVYDVLPGEDCTEELTEALKHSRYLYFPDGVYTFSDLTITADTVFVLAPDARLHTDAGRMVAALGCSFSILGGDISSGTEYPDRPSTPYDDASRTMQYKTNNHNEGIIELYGCHDCVFERITVPYSSSPAVFQVYGDSNGTGGNRPVTIDGKSVVPGACRNIRFDNCSFNNTLLSAIHVLYHCKNVVVDGCTFTNALRAKGIPYCYTVYTGVKSISTDKDLYFTPTDGYVVRNCYVGNCEGTGIDTHAASNVLYENNTLIDCDSFITAYHDYRRVRTAEGWVMENIIVRNNRCRTTKDFDYENNEYPHNPFMLHNNGPMKTMRNIVVENNTIETNWYYLGSEDNPWEIIALQYADNVILHNNTIVSSGQIGRAAYIAGCSNMDIDNLTLVGAYEAGLRFDTVVCKVGTIDCKLATFDNAVLVGSENVFCSVIDTDSMIINNPLVTPVSGWRWVLNRYGRLLQAAETYLPLDGKTVATGEGFTAKDATDGPPVISINGNRVTTATYRLPPGSRVAVGTTGNTLYHIIDVESYYLEDSETKRFVSVLDRDVEQTDAGYIVITSPQKSAYSEKGSYPYNDRGTVESSTDFNNYTTPGVYMTNGRAFTNAPFTTTSYSRLEVKHSVNSSTYVQTLYAPSESMRGVYIRFKLSSSWTPWYKLAMTEV